MAAADLVERVVAICQSEIERLDVVVELDDRSQGAQIKIDLDQLIQVCLNLILNALEAMEGASIDPVEFARPPRRIDIGLTCEDNEVSLIFTDTGPGIPAHLVDRIFDPFVTSKAAGTGLGLARVFAVAEAHGGWIEARNLAMGGAEFRLVLPRYQEAEHVSDDPHR
jgi:signal transduction histidine kinase